MAVMKDKRHYLSAFTINDEIIPRNNAAQGKVKRAKMIFEDLQEKFGL